MTKTPIQTKEKQEFIPATAGRPTKYRPEMCDIVIQVAQDGGFHAAMMVACGIGNDAFYTYKREIPEFAEAVDQADLISLAIQEAALVDGMLGKIKNYNFSANAMILNNKWRAQYARTNGGSNGDTNIEITNNTINLSPQERDDKIQQLLQKLKASGNLPAGILSSPVIVENNDNE